MHNRRYIYLADNNILFNKQFGFRAGHSTERAFLELIDQISNSFIDKLYFLGIFIELSKAFDTADHKILLKKLHPYGIKLWNKGEKLVLIWELSNGSKATH